MARDQDEDRRRGGEREREGENLEIPGGSRRATAIIACETYLDLKSNCKKISSSTFMGQLESETWSMSCY